MNLPVISITVGMITIVWLIPLQSTVFMMSSSIASWLRGWGSVGQTGSNQRGVIFIKNQVWHIFDWSEAVKFFVRHCHFKIMHVCFGYRGCMRQYHFTFIEVYGTQQIMKIAVCIVFYCTSRSHMPVHQDLTHQQKIMRGRQENISTTKAYNCENWE